MIAGKKRAPRSDQRADQAPRLYHPASDPLMGSQTGWCKWGARLARWSNLAARLYHPVCHPAKGQRKIGLGISPRQLLGLVCVWVKKWLVPLPDPWGKDHNLATPKCERRATSSQQLQCSHTGFEKPHETALELVFRVGNRCKSIGARAGGLFQAFLGPIWARKSSKS